MTPGWLVAGMVGTLACTIRVHPRAVTLAYILVLPCCHNWRAHVLAQEWKVFDN